MSDDGVVLCVWEDEFEESTEYCQYYDEHGDLAQQQDLKYTTSVLYLTLRKTHRT